MKEENKDIIIGVTKNLLSALGFDCKVSIIEDKNDEERVVCNIESESETNLLIGQGGENLQAIQHLARLLVRRKTDDLIKFVVDVNLYKKEQESSVLDLAREMAEKAIKEKKTVVLKPMSAYNRRLVHMYLSDNKNVVTESTGDDGERRVVIKPL